MDTIKFLIGLIIRLVIALILIYVVFWLVSSLFPELKPKNIFSGNFLPAPGSVSLGLIGSKTPDGYENVYVPQEFRGYVGVDNNRLYGNQANFLTYTNTGGGISNPDTNYQNPYAERSLYIRNLSIFEGGKVYSGLTFTGEAKETMFRDGKFAIIIADRSGRPVSYSFAQSTNTWATPGWIRFQAKIGSIVPNNVPCIMVFQSGNNTTLQTAMPIVCSNF